MSIILVSILGTYPYEITKYQYEDGYYETPYGVMALLSLYFKRHGLIDKDLKVFIAGTSDGHHSSKSVHFLDSEDNRIKKDKNGNTYDNLYYQLSEFFNQNNLSKDQFDFISLPSNLGLPESWNTFEILKDKINIKEDDELYIDITNGYRTQQVILLMTLNYLESLFGKQVVKKVFYCKYENGPEIVDLTEMYFLTKWANAIDTFIHTGQYSHFEKLFVRINDNKNPIYKYLKNISNAIKRLSRALRLAKVGFYDFISDDEELYEDCIAYCVYNLHQQIYQFENSKHNKEMKDAYIILDDLLKRLKKQFNWMTYQPQLSKEEVREMLIKSYYTHIYKIILYYKDTEMIQQGLTVLNEMFFIRKKEINKENPAYSYLLRFKQLFNKMSLKQNVKKLRDKLNTILKQYRNSIDHSFYIECDRKGNIKNVLKYTSSQIINEFNQFILNPALKEYANELNQLHHNIYQSVTSDKVDTTILQQRFKKYG